MTNIVFKTFLDIVGTRDPHQPVQFLSFLCSFCQKFCQIIDWCSLLGNPGSATEKHNQKIYEMFSNLKIISQIKDALN